MLGPAVPPPTGRLPVRPAVSRERTAATDPGSLARWAATTVTHSRPSASEP